MKSAHIYLKLLTSFIHNSKSCYIIYNNNNDHKYTINYKYDKIRIVNYFGIYKHELCFEVRVDYSTTNINHKINYNATKNKKYYAFVNKKIANTYKHSVLCNMLTYIHNINLFNCICLVDNNKNKLYRGRRRER